MLVSFIPQLLNNLVMKLIPFLVDWLNEEAETTKKMIELVPEEKFTWKPHDKSMTLLQLATHIAEIPSWIPMMINHSELDFANFDYKPTPVANTGDLTALLKQSLDAAFAALNNVQEAQLDEEWIMRNGDTIYLRYDKSQSVRHAYSQLIHHRAQLGVYLRLLDIPIPGSYGPSADDTSFMGG